MDIEEVKKCLTSLTLSEHMGDVANVLPRLSRALNLPEPRWAYWGNSEGYVYPWDEEEINQDLLDEDEEPLRYAE